MGGTSGSRWADSPSMSVRRPRCASWSSLAVIGAPSVQVHSEFTGPTFSLDGKILSVNIQSPGITLAITWPLAGLPALTALDVAVEPWHPDVQ
jgi:hypothetical protein